LENALVSAKIEHPDYEQAITVDGRAWVYVDDGVVVGFVCGRLEQRDIWALFASESHQRRGIGTALMGTVEAWMFEQRVDSIVLTTEPGTQRRTAVPATQLRCEGTTTAGRTASSAGDARWSGATERARSVNTGVSKIARECGGDTGSTGRM
jgi:GNAT superfamily N-acetyltransferase